MRSTSFQVSARSSSVRPQSAARGRRRRTGAPLGRVEDGGRLVHGEDLDGRPSLPSGISHSPEEYYALLERMHGPLRWITSVHAQMPYDDTWEDLNMEPIGTRF